MNGNALTYLICTKLRNRIVEFFKKPVRIIYVVIFLGLFIMTLVGGKSAAADPDRVLRDINELCAIISALLLLIFSITFFSGLSSGGTIFKMADVNYLFPAPLNKRNVLFYALIQQMGSALLIGFFILFQYTALHASYNLSLWGLLLICLLYSLTVFTSQTLSLLVYTFVSDNDKKKRNAKLVSAGILIALIVYVGLGALKNQDNLIPTLAAYGNSLPVFLFPFSGWLSGVAAGIFTGNYISAAIWLLISIGAFVAVLVVMSRSKREYYEDVLASAENIQSAIVNAKDGVVPEPSPRNIKVGASGINRGMGASVMFYKHLLENRRSTKLILSTPTMIFVATTIAFAFFLRTSGVIPIFAFSSYMLIFSQTNGRFNRELFRHYVYLIPESSTKKMAWALMETMPTALVEAIVTFVPICFLVGASPLEFVFCIIARLSFVALFTAGNIAVERIWGGSLSKMAGVLVYLFINIILALPGLALAIIFNAIGVQILGEAVTILAALSIANIPVSLFVLFLCRNMLQYAEVNS